MTTADPKFNCIFCKDVFDNKEDLQVHFRKHGDPSFKREHRKINPSVNKESQVSNERVEEKTDNTVSCDVCSQMFPTISKAITHKHKVHPDHDAKYFCPWCGKLFTMKHPYNVHIQTSHCKQEKIENKVFHCDSCDVDFYIPSAMIYHNKFFHRQETDIPEVGVSKKLRLYNQEIVQLCYCSFCGEEYENRVNLFKHITDDHSEENQIPEEVLRCPLCEAIFYHLDAYEIHLSFHTTEDLYSATNELFADLLDFSLETVPPIIEKVENQEDLDAEAQSQDTADSGNTLGIENFLELALDQAEDSNPAKVKKKKHKKSKKSAITLDEFLSMNQDVFGEGLDFHGVEEVPTRVVTKHLKPNKKVTNAAAAAELEKLKQKGILVMKVASKPDKITPKKPIKPTPSGKQLTTSNDVINKLINQSNNQIKIVKKAIPKIETEKVTTNAANEDAQNIDDLKINDKSKKDLERDEKESEATTKLHDLPVEAEPTATNTKRSSPLTTPNSIQESYQHEDHETDNESEEPVPPTHPEPLNVNNDSVVTSEVACNSPKLEDKENLDSTDVKDQNDSKDTSDLEENSETGNPKDVNIDTEKNSDSEEHVNTIKDSSNDQSAKSVANTLSTLKYLSHLTVKPVLQSKDNSFKPDTSLQKNDLKSQLNNSKELSRSTITTDPDKFPIRVLPDKSPKDTLKVLNKNITIKPLSTPTKRTIDHDSCNDDEANMVIKQQNNIKIKDISEDKPFTLKKIKTENNELSGKSNQLPKIINKINTTGLVQPHKNVIDSCEQKSTKNSTDILKNLPNITSKPLTVKKSIESIKQSAVLKPAEVLQKETEVIEISDIDEDSDGAGDCAKLPEPKQDTANPLKNLSKHITIKTFNPPQTMLKNIKVEKIEEHNEDDGDFSDSSPPHTKVCSQKLSSRNSLFQNTLKNLGKNITVKSRTSSPLHSVTSQDSDPHEEAPVSDYDSDTEKVKITEINDNNNFNDEDPDNAEHCEEEDHDNEPIVQSPHDSCSDHDDCENDAFDFESDIKVSTVSKNNDVNNKNNTILNNLKSISKNLTIKSIDRQQTEENFKPVQVQENPKVKNLIKNTAKPSKQLVKESPHSSTVINKSFQNNTNLDHTAKESLNQKVSVNKEVTVKTFQTKTVIQEITTTVTKTIKTVNQTVKQETKKSSQMNIPVLPRRVQGMRPSTSKNLQGVVIRHSPPAAVRPNIVVAQNRPIVRPSKQIVPVRPAMNVIRNSIPRMQSPKINLPKSSPNKQVMGKPLKISPSVIGPRMVKRPNVEEVSGPFSCFKKPKESLIPVSEVSTYGNAGESSVQVNAASHTTTSNFMSATKTIKGNTVVTAIQSKSEVKSMQQLSTVNTSDGVQIKSAQIKQTQVQEKSESNSMKRTTLEAIEKLQKQGLLVKKPRIEVDEFSDSERADDNVGYSSTEEQDE